MKKIITHAGTFHADELCAAALLLREHPDTPIERTYTPKPEDFADPDIAVLDVGRQYDPGFNNFDHHQDASAPATNILVLRDLYPGHTPEEDRLVELLEKYFFAYISRVDVGDVVENADSPPTISGIIRACNNLPEAVAFDTALAIMCAAVNAQFATAYRRIESEKMWEGVEKRGDVAIHDSTTFIVGWHELAELAGIRFLVTPNLRGGYQVTSRDSARWVIPPHPAQTFRHNSGFLAVYPDIETAIKHASEL